VLGCLIVLALSHLATRWLSTTVFLGATGLAHAFTVARYFITATAATVMALLQDHLANPHGGFAILERLADTAMGALLAWAFSFVLPSWERQGLPRLLARLLRSLDSMASHVLRLPAAGETDLGLRLARREVYEALRALAAAGQRTKVEPRAVRVPSQAFARLLAHSHALMAHLASVRILLSRRRDELDPVRTARLLAVVRASIEAELRRPADAALVHDGERAFAERDLPPDASAQELMPWLERRLHLAAAEAAMLVRAARVLSARAGVPYPRSP